MNLRSRMGILGLFAFFLLTLSVSAASPEPRRLVLLCPAGSGQRLAARAVERFEEKHPGWKVSIISSSGKDYYVKCLTMLAAGSPVDVLWLGMGFGAFADRGILLPIDPLLAGDPDISLSDFTPQALAMYRLDGTLYGLPYGLDFQALVINETLLQLLGLPVPADDWTLDDMIGLGRASSRTAPGRGRVYGLGMATVPAGFWGLSLLTEDGRAFGLNHREGLERLKTNIRLSDEGVLLRSAGTGQLDRLNEFVSGKVAIMEIYSWELPELRSAARFQWRVMPVPRAPAGNERAWASSSGYCISARSTQQAMAWSLLKELSGADFQRSLFGTMLPTRSALVAPYEASLEPRERAILKIIPKLAPDPRIKIQEKIASEYDYWSSKAMLKQLPPEEALEIAATRINRILARERAATQPISSSK